jgi:hypothetical protein
MHRYRQLHLWISEHDYAALRAAATARRETLSSLIRHLIKSCEGRASDEVPAMRPGEPRVEVTSTLSD